MKKISSFFLILSIISIFLSFPGCKKDSSETTLNEIEKAQLEAEQAAEEAAAAAEAAQKQAAPPPKMNEDVYVQITARSALIRDKFKDDPDQADKEVEALYDKFGVTFNEYKEFQGKLTPQRLGELQTKINDFMQKIVNEYR